MNHSTKLKISSTICKLVSLVLITNTLYVPNASAAALNLEEISALVKTGELVALANHKGFVSAIESGLLPEGLEGVGKASLEQGASSLIVRLTGASGKYKTILKIANTTSKDLASTRPSTLQKQLFKNLAIMSASTVGHTLMRFVPESFSFFVALGSISTAELIFKYNENPGAYSDLFEGQLNLVGQAGFLAFMTANGLTAQPLMAIVSNKNLHKYIPYLGMSVGMTASKIVEEVGNFPGLRQCALQHDEKACDMAYDKWTKTKFGSEAAKMTPSLMSMVLTTFAMGTAKGILTSAFNYAAKKSATIAAELTGINLILALDPRLEAMGWAVRMGFTVGLIGLQVAETAGFIEGTNIIEVPLTHVFNNVFGTGSDVMESQQTFAHELRDKKWKRWDAPEWIAQDVQNFSKQMTEWRANSAIGAINAHNRWLGFLENLSAGYNISKVFYGDFIKDVWRAKYDPETIDHPDLRRVYPLFGIYHDIPAEPVALPSSDDLEKLLDRKNAGPSKEDIEALNFKINIIKQLGYIPGAPYNLSAYLVNDDGLENAQMARVHQAAAMMERMIYDSKNKVKSWFQHLPADLQHSWAEIFEAFSNSDKMRVGRALIKMNAIIDDGDTPLYNQNNNKLYGFSAYLQLIRDYLGDPKPIMTPGEGYLKIKDAIYQKMGFVNPFLKFNQNIAIRNSTEAMALGMLTGPDVEYNESAVKANPAGFNAFFVPPRILKAPAFYSTEYNSELSNHPAVYAFFKIFDDIVVSHEKLLGMDNIFHMQYGRYTEKNRMRLDLNRNLPVSNASDSYVAFLPPKLPNLKLTRSGPNSNLIGDLAAFKNNLKDSVLQSLDFLIHQGPLHDLKVLANEFNQQKNAFLVIAGENAQNPGILEEFMDSAPKQTNYNSGTFDKWWSRYLENQYTHAFQSYEKKYQDIILNLTTDLFKDEDVSNVLFYPDPHNRYKGTVSEFIDKATNWTGISVGLVPSARQEIELYLTFLRRLYTDDRPKAELAAWDAKANKATWEIIVKSEAPLEQLLRGIKQQVEGQWVNGRWVSQQPISSDDLDFLQKQLNASLQNIYKDLKPELHIYGQDKLLTALLKSIQTAFADIVNYGKMANAVNFTSRMGGSKQNTLPSKHATGTSQTLADTLMSAGKSTLEDSLKPSLLCKELIQQSESSFDEP